jgi:hypothetical protein
MEFVKIKNLERYEISKNSIIRNVENLKIKSQYISSTGYYMISVSTNNKTKPYRVHRLLAEMFIPKIDGFDHVNHKDGNKLNNSLDNLEWCTNKQNIQHAFKNGLINNTNENNGMAKLNKESVIEIKKLLASGLSQYKIAKTYNVSRSAILKIKLNKTWSNI